MTRSLVLFALPLALATGCAMQTYDFEEASVMTPPPRAIHGIPLPDSKPIRELHTQCREVKSTKGVVGYVVVYQEVPAFDRHLERRYPEGTVLVENASFELIGVITAHGRATRFVGDKAESLGQGTIDELLPQFFGQKGLSHAPISS